MEQSEKKFDIKEFVIRRKVDVGFLLAGILLGTLLNWDVIEIILFAVFVWSIVGPIMSRYLVLPALFFLSFTPILLAVGRKEQAEEYAIYAYYFLIMVVIRAIIEIRTEKNEDQASEKP